MRRLVVSTLATGGLLALVALAAAQEGAPNMDCVEVRAEARQNGVGFMHVVMVTNRCSASVTCQLATDADPSPTQTLRLAPNQSGEVVTRAASPAGGIQAISTCTYDAVGPTNRRRGPVR